MLIISFTSIKCNIFKIYLVKEVGLVSKSFLMITSKLLAFRPRSKFTLVFKAGKITCQKLDQYKLSQIFRAKLLQDKKRNLRITFHIRG